MKGTFLCASLCKYYLLLSQGSWIFLWEGNNFEKMNDKLLCAGLKRLNTSLLKAYQVSLGHFTHKRKRASLNHQKPMN